MIMKKILVVEDEPQIAKFLTKTFLVLGYDVDHVSSSKDATFSLKVFQPDIIILDLGLPDIDGHQWLIDTRKYSDIPIIVVSARSRTEDVVKALENGANDYVKKPFDMAELIARLNKCLNQSQENDTLGIESKYIFGNMCVDISGHHVTLDDKEIHLSKKEFQILSYLVLNANRLVTQEDVLKKVWGNYSGDGAQYLRVYICQLRKKLLSCTKQPLITTENAIGYRFINYD